MDRDFPGGMLSVADKLSRYHVLATETGRWSARIQFDFASHADLSFQQCLQYWGVRSCIPSVNYRFSPAVQLSTTVTGIVLSPTGSRKMNLLPSAVAQYSLAFGETIAGV
jgi:hypothetical protein